MLYFRDADKLVGRMAARGFARSQFEGGEGHEGLIAECGRAEGRHAHGDAPLYERMVLRDE